MNIFPNDDECACLYKTKYLVTKEVGQLLNQQGVGLHPPEMHGLIAGMLCGCNKKSSGQPLLHDLINEGLAFGHALAQAMRASASDSLDDDEEEAQEELEMSVEYIIEYARVAALLCHDAFTRQQPTAPEVRKPTLC